MILVVLLLQHVTMTCFVGRTPLRGSATADDPRPGLAAETGADGRAQLERPAEGTPLTPHTDGQAWRRRGVSAAGPALRLNNRHRASAPTLTERKEECLSTVSGYQYRRCRRPKRDRTTTELYSQYNYVEDSRLDLINTSAKSRVCNFLVSSETQTLFNTVSL